MNTVAEIKQFPEIVPETDPRTRVVRAGLESDASTGAVVPPIHLSATYAFRGYGEKREYDYSRSGNPTRDMLAEALSDLEGGEGAVITASGMAAVALTAQLLPARARVVAPHDCYGGSYRLFDALHRRGDLQVEFVNFGDAAALRAALSRPTGLLWIETPSNPLLRVTDIAAVAALGRAAGALTVVDNTFLSPAWQQPLRFGADLVVHSTTKYINGHSDIVGGAVIAARKDLLDQLSWWANCLGLTGAPFDSFMTLRGLRTLHARLAIHGRNALELAQWLAQQPAVSKVYYPGLPSHPGHDIACRQQSGFGAVVTFELAGGSRAVKALLTGLRYFSLAESLGGVESLIAHPASMTHAAMQESARRSAGLTDGLLRLSVGIEAVEDLRADLAAGIARCRDC